jgi:hypothetical protein
MGQAAELAMKYPEIVRLLDNCSLSFPIPTKNDFIEQLVASRDQIEFRGVMYDTRFGAGLLPSFFFPLESADDLIVKTVELLISRGLLNFSSRAG